MVDMIRSLGAFVPKKLDDLLSEEERGFGQELFREYPKDISMSTGGLYLAIRKPQLDENFANLVKEHFTNLGGIVPTTAIEMNNKAFAYDSFGLLGDPTVRNRRINLAYPFGIDGFPDIQPLYEAAIAEDPMLWEPRYNLAGGLLHLWSWQRNPEQDEIYFERAFEELHAVLKLDPRNVLARIKLAVWFRDWINPYQMLDEALEIDPNNEEAKEQIKNLREIGYEFIHPSMFSLKGLCWQLRMAGYEYDPAFFGVIGSYLQEIGIRGDVPLPYILEIYNQLKMPELLSDSGLN